MRSAKSTTAQKSASFPVWYSPASPLGSAVHYIASLSPRYQWVGISVLKGKTLILGPDLGKRKKNITQSKLDIPIHSPKGKILGQIDIESDDPRIFDGDEKKAIHQIAKELGELWPE